MTGGDLFKAGRLAEAVATQIQEVKASPADPGKRVLLFELLAFTGDLDRALRQIDAVQYGDPERDATVLTYRMLLSAEQARRHVFREGSPPSFLAEPPEHVRLRLEAVQRLREGKSSEAAELLQRADGACAGVNVVVNGRPVEAFRDGDDVFGPVLEVIAQGKYYWVPLDQIDALATNPPVSPRDLLWLPARLDMAEASGEVFLPTLYPFSHEHADDQFKLGRQTEWKYAAEGIVQGVGQHTFLVGEEAIGLLDVRQLEVEPPA